jgi:4'-phosphopantetheinyl transferase EntD
VAGIEHYGMPLILDITTPEESRVGVWHVAEDALYFQKQLSLSDTENAVLQGLRPVKKTEWLASRYLLDTLVDHHERIETGTLDTGKPFLVDRGEEISLSHSDQYVAAMVGNTPVGVDIQQCKEKILRVEHKFAHPEESKQIDRSNALLHLHVLWGAKEALYKVHAKKQLSFSRHIFVRLPPALGTSGQFAGEIRADHGQIDCILYYRILKEYVLVYAQKTTLRND